MDSDTDRVIEEVYANYFCFLCEGRITSFTERKDK